MSPVTRIFFLLASLSVVALPVSALAFQPATKAEPAAATTAAGAGDPASIGDVVRGKRVFQVTGKCTYCHGWAADGQHGKHPRSPGVAANLRKSQLDAEAMKQVVRCGIPGTAMPYHLSAAYKDPEICGMTIDDFAKGDMLPVRGKTFREQDVANVVAYIKSLGSGDVTLADCEAALKPGDKACDEFR